MRESEIQRVILEWLAAKHIFSLRMNTGAMTSEYRGKKRFMRFGEPGQADILAFVSRHYEHCGAGFDEIKPTWIEVKAEKGKQSDLQKSFQAKVESEGHMYILARSLDDVMAVLK